MVVQSKHFLNTPPSLVVDSLRGLCALNPQIALDEANKVVHIATPDRSKVAIVCGGGSGHEPAHPGFVGEGMLTAAVCGTVFASPSASQVRQAINLVDNNKGTLIVVKNYTGDILNFGLAKEHYAAAHPEKADKVKFVIVADDVAVGRTQGSIVGRRGLAGTCLVYKIAGALAQRGALLDEVYNTAQYVATRLGTVGVGLEHCHVPGTAVPDAHLGAQELEIGLGIHNESGFRRVSPVPPLNELIPNLVEMIMSTSDPERSFLPFKGGRQDRVVVMINNLGGLSALELGAITGETVRVLDAFGTNIERVLSGSFMSSLNMPGFSITLLLLPGANEPFTPSSDLILSLLDQETSTPGWAWLSKTQPSAAASISHATPAPDSHKGSKKLKADNPMLFNDALKRACEALIAAEPEITRMDSIAGDGDCGLTLKAGASATLKKLEEGVISGDDVVGSTIAIADVAENSMGGTSGALYSIFFSALAQNLVTNSTGSEATAASWAKALQGALDRLYSYTRARPPSRTLVDPLAAFVINLPQGFASAVSAAAAAAKETANLAAKAGRSAYVEGDRLKAEKIPDPGAWGVKVLLEALATN